MMDVNEEKQKEISESKIEKKTDNPSLNSANLIYTKKQLTTKSGLTPDKKKSEHKSQNQSVEKEEKGITTKPKVEVPSSQKKITSKNPSSKVMSMNSKVIETYKISTESEKERRAYEEKVQAMQNRLAALKKQENELLRKMRMYNTKEKELDQVKIEKEAFKNALNSFKIERQRILEEQKRKNEEEKIRLASAVENSIKENKIKKHADFDLARNEKQIIVSLISENNEQLDDINQRKINQIKSELENFRDQEQRKQNQKDEQMIQYYLEKKERDGKATSRLKNQMAQLEKLEEQYLESLQTTQNAHKYTSSLLKTNSNLQKTDIDIPTVKKIQLDSIKKDKKQVRSQSTTNEKQNKNIINVNKPETNVTKESFVSKKNGNSNNSNKIVIDRKAQK